MEIVLVIAMILIGAGTAAQTAMNAQLRESLGHTITGSAINFSIGLLCLVGLFLALRIPAPSFSAIAAVPAWAWLGGVIGAVFVAVSSVASRDLGILLTFSLLIAGQVLGSAVLDHFGWMGFAPRPINLMKLVGAILLVVGVLMIKRA